MLKILKYLSFAGIPIGVAVLIAACKAAAAKIGIARFTDLTGLPAIAVKILGVIAVLAFFPVFIAGVLELLPKGAAGGAENLKTGGVYKYVRNPIYSGIAFTIVGIGLVLNSTGVALAGLGWLALTYAQAKREENRLAGKYGAQYLEYKNKTPMFIPKITLRKIFG